ncbi:hypothetical protein FACS189487_02390 [Campylobacterota bacterium]|nr:hypothetical protein FACS189487_02390 [Campylobacterota bacterium]
MVKFWHIILALVVVLLALIFWRVEAENSMREAVEKRDEAAFYAEKIGRLRSSWENNQAVKQKTQQLFGEEPFKSLGNTQITQQGLKAELKNLDAQMINRLTRQILEQPVQIKSFAIERKGDEAADISLEIVW